jgi:polyhydroxybutyrate depolymerase
MRRSRPLAPLLSISVLVSVTLAACGGDEDRGRGAGGSSKPAEKPPAAVDGIPTATGTHHRKLDVGTFGHREFLLHVPPKLTRTTWRDGKPERPLPLVVALHGGLSNMRQMRTLTGFDGLSDREGFLVAYPDGFLTTWNAGYCCGPAKLGKIPSGSSSRTTLAPEPASVLPAFPLSRRTMAA